jgi:hypothetical protein
MSIAGAAKHVADRGSSAAAAGVLHHAANERGRRRQHRADVRSGLMYEVKACTWLPTDPKPRQNEALASLGTATSSAHNRAVQVTQSRR